MNDIKLYAFTLFCCCAAAGFIEFLTPEGLRKQTSYITGMLILLCMLSPVKELLGESPIRLVRTDMTKPAAVSADELLESEFSGRLEKIIRDNLAQAGIFEPDVRIEINISGSEVTIESADVILGSADSADAGEVEQMLERQLGLDVSVSCSGR